MKQLLTAVVFFCGLAASQNRNIDHQIVTTPTGTWELVWDEEFDYTGLPDTTKWSYDTMGNATSWGNNEAQFYTHADTNNVWVENGKLTIKAIKKAEGGKAYTSARILTKGKGDWKYGRFEICAKLPTGRGTWPAIWMLPTDWEYGGWPKSGEIDIMENVGYDPDTVLSTAHTQKYNHMIGTQASGKLYVPDSDKKFHVYALEWDENEWRSYVDDVHYYTHKKNDENFEGWPFDKRFHLLLNLAIGGNWGGKYGIDDTLLPHQFEVDYVRVYKKTE